MRREIYRSDRDRAVALLARAPFVHVAGVDDGRPVGRTLHGVVVGDSICFHAAPAGEKSALVGTPVVIWAEEIVAEIPSYFVDEERACPATTLYDSAQVHGVLERIDDLDKKAAVLAALMARFQPEGGHVPLDPAHPRYRELYEKAVRGILVTGVSLAVVDGKAKLGQNRTVDERARMLAALWERGGRGDPRAIELVRSANGDKAPAFLASPVDGVELCCAVDESRAEEAAALLADAYWNVDVPREAIARAHRASSAWVGAMDASGALVATARALGDGAKWGTIYDVMVRADRRGRGLGRALVKLLLDHPALRGCRKINLRTRDAQSVYAAVGFEERVARHTEMILER